MSLILKIIIKTPYYKTIKIPHVSGKREYSLDHELSYRLDY